MPCSLTRRIAFHARHRYYRDDWSEEENRRRFGWTAEAPGHGHLYQVEVTVGGPLDPATQMIIDLAALDLILSEEIIAPLAGRLLNAEVEPFRSGKELPTCEALAAWCWGRVAGRLHGKVQLVRIRVAEDETLWADCTGPS